MEWWNGMTKQISESENWNGAVEWRRAVQQCNGIVNEVVSGEVEWMTKQISE